MKNIILWLVLSYFVVYAAVFWLLGYEATAYLIAALLFGLAAMVLATWGTTGWRAIKQGGREGEAVLAFAICVAAFYGVCTRLWSIYRISMDNPDWMATSPIGLGLAVLLLIFFTGVLLAPETKGGNVPTKNLIWWAVALFLAGGFVGGVMGVTLSKDVPKIDGMTAPMSVAPTSPCTPPKSVFVRAYCRARPGVLNAG